MPNIVNKGGDTAEVEDSRVLLEVLSGGVLSQDALLFAYLENQLDGGDGRSFKASLQVAERCALPCPEGNKYGQEPSCWILLH